MRLFMRYPADTIQREPQPDIAYYHPDMTGYLTPQHIEPSTGFFRTCPHCGQYVIWPFGLHRSTAKAISIGLIGGSIVGALLQGGVIR